MKSFGFMEFVSGLEALLEEIHHSESSFSEVLEYENGLWLCKMIFPLSGSMLDKLKVDEVQF